MKKEYRSEKLSYNVLKHGDTHVYDFGVRCPECSSFIVSVVNEEHSDRFISRCIDDIEEFEFLCKECGCKFNVYVEHYLTDSGRKLKTVLNIIIAIMSALTAVFLISGVCFVIAHKILGIVFIVVAIATGIVATVVSDMNDDI